MTAVHLEVRVWAPSADPEVFAVVAERAKAGGPVSKVLNAAITMTANLRD